MNTKVSDLKSIQLKLANPEDILSWSYGEVVKPETINYRTQRPEKGGLFAEEIFGPEKDYECYCGKYRRVRYKGVVCDKCGVEVTRSSVRRERMGHIKLAAPVAHIWFLRGMPSRMSLLLDIPMQQLEKVVYYASYIVTHVDEEKRENAKKEIANEYKKKVKTKSTEEEKAKLKEARDKEVSRLKGLKELAVLNEYDYHSMSLKYGEIFEAQTGAGPVRQILENLDLKELIKKLEKEMEETKTVAVKRKLQRRLTAAQRMMEVDVRPEWMFLTYIPIMPPDLRPMVQLDGGRYASSDMNDLYRRVINRNNRLKRLQELNAPEVITRNEKRMLQEAVDALIDNSARQGKTVVTATSGGKRALKSIADMLKGKQGRFRQNLLGKRVDYSGRSVIVVGPDLELDTCGLPKKMALELFRPFVVQQLIEKEFAYNVRAANHLIDEQPPEVWAVLEEVIQGKYVLLNRAPTLHRLGVQAFKPILIEGNAIQLHPLVCSAFNADFDGDQMAVHLPLSEEAQEEARNLMLSSQNLAKPATGMPIANPTLEILLGTYWMSKIQDGRKGEGKMFPSEDDVRLAYDSGIIDLKAKIKLRIDRDNPKFSNYEGDDRFIETCAGRVVFNHILPDDFEFINEELNAKQVKAIISKLYQHWPKEVVVEMLDKVKKMGYLYATMSGVTWGMDDLTVPEEKPAVLEEAHKKVKEIHEQFEEGLLSPQERKTKVIEVWSMAKREIEKLVPNYFDPDESVATIVDSGAKGSTSQIVQMAGMKGSVTNPAGQELETPIEHSYKEGFTPLEYFSSTHGARKGTVDTALRTATAGHLTRRLVDVAQDLVVKSDDCEDTQGIVLARKDLQETGQKFEDKIFGRTALKGIKSSEGKILVKNGDIINLDSAKEIDADETIEEISVRSPLTCKDESICATCYGLDFGRNEKVKLGEAVGVVAAQAIGEPGTQLTMRTFHTGGVAGGADITMGLPRVEEVFEARNPKGKAVISEVEGKVESIKEEQNHKIVAIRANQGKNKKEDIKEYKTPLNMALWVDKGDLVVPGTQLTEGHVDLKELYDQTDKEEAQKYIVKEVQKMYTSQGASVHDKHIEVIARQMFSRIKITEAGDSSFNWGEIVSYARFMKANKELKKARKQEAKGERVIQGITKASLSTDSFLSAASFQETARVLIRAALEGNVDELEGLKENVIIGKMIPAGTGFKKK